VVQAMTDHWGREKHRHIPRLKERLHGGKKGRRKQGGKSGEELGRVECPIIIGYMDGCFQEL
jgi:hypothetical protein